MTDEAAAHLANLELLLRGCRDHIQEQERLIRGAQARVLELRAALCLVLLELDEALARDPWDELTKGQATARATLGLGTREDPPEAWYIPGDARKT